MSVTPTNAPSIPESITIQGITYAVKDYPEIQQFIQSVARVEKSKLYSQMDALKSQIQSLSNVEVVSETAQPAIDVKALVEALKDTFVPAATFKETIGDTVKEVVQPILDATKQSQQEELAAYREKLIRENNATCIPDLVKGNTKEELEASLKESIRLRSAYPSPTAPAPQYTGDPALKQQMQSQQPAQSNSPPPTQQPAAPAPQPPTPPTPPAVPNRPAPDAFSRPVTTTRQMSMEEFSKQREALRANLEALYGGQQ